MLRITPDQLLVFSNLQRAKFLEALAATAQAETPEAVIALGPDKLGPALDEMVRRAEEFGVLECDPIERVALIALESAGSVWNEADGWGLDILTDKRLSGLSKALKLEWRALLRRHSRDG